MWNYVRSLLYRFPAVARQMTRLSYLDQKVSEHNGRLDFLEHNLARASQINNIDDDVFRTYRRIAILEATVETHRDWLDAIAASPSSAAEPGRTQRTIYDRSSAQAIRYEQLLNREVAAPAEFVFIIHVPKAGGNSLYALLQQNGFNQISIDTNTNDFFSICDENRIFNYDGKNSPQLWYYFSGHYRLDHSVFKKMAVPYVTISLLRDPIEIILSHYNFTLRRSGAPWHAEVVGGEMSFLEYARNIYKAVGPMFRFFDESGRGTFAPTGSSSPQSCLENLLNKVSFYGFTDRFAEFRIILGYLQLSKNILYSPSANITKEIPDMHGIPAKTSLDDQERKHLAEMVADDIWFYSQAREEYNRRISNPAIQKLLASVMPLSNICSDAMAELDVLDDPANPATPAFSRFYK